jgi:predicted SAM-dependent methyltransferase
MLRKLHIGGKVRAEGWEVLNALPGPYVDHVGNANDLVRFADGTFGEVYASHILEHLDYKDELLVALKEWHRVLAPGGSIRISVPDMDMLCQMFLARDQLDVPERFFVMRMMFGGHVDRYDYHVVGLNYEFLEEFLELAGFGNVRRVERFGLFEDTSVLQFRGVAISLNVIADKPAV